jgi:hypothetical protein
MGVTSVAAQAPARTAAVVIAAAEQPDGRILAGPPASTTPSTAGSATVLAVTAGFELDETGAVVRLVVQPLGIFLPKT